MTPSSPDSGTPKVISTSKLASTSALILGLLSLLSFALAVIGFALDWGWVTGNDWAWFLLPGFAFGCGIIAVYLGILGMREARREPDGEGLGVSVFASVAGGLVALIVLGAVLAIAATFVVLIFNYPQG